MKSPTNGHIKMAVKALRANRWRSFLTMLGVIIGVASVISVVSIGQGVKNQVSGQINKFGKDLITVRATRVGSGVDSKSSLGLLSSLNVLSPLPERDYKTIADTPQVGTAVPLVVADGQVRGDESPADSVVIGTTENLPVILNHSMAYGVFFAGDEADSHVAVLGERAAIRIFSENVPLGRSFTFRGEQFVVRGIFDSFSATPLSGEADFNDAVFIPYNVAETMTRHNAPLYEVLAKPNNPDQTDTTIASINKRLLASHGGQADFIVQKSSQSLAANSAILDLLTRLIGGIAAISLLVGGVGIMNVMLVSVTERMHEIGIRKAVGATNRQIHLQFMVEAAVLSMVGAFIGIILALLLNLILRILTSLQPAFSWQVIALAAGVSLLVGIVFGSAPAFKAARKQPIDALRNE